MIIRMAGQNYQLDNSQKDSQPTSTLGVSPHFIRLLYLQGKY